MNTHSQEPHEKMPEYLSTAKTCTTKDEKIDAQMADSFPASDPPSFSGGNHIIGAPQTGNATRGRPITQQSLRPKGR